MTELPYLIWTLVAVTLLVVTFILGWHRGYSAASAVYGSCSTCGAKIRWYSFYWAHVVPQADVDHNVTPREKTP